MFRIGPLWQCCTSIAGLCCLPCSSCKKKKKRERARGSQKKIFLNTQTDAGGFFFKQQHSAIIRRLTGRRKSSSCVLVRFSKSRSSQWSYLRYSPHTSHFVMMSGPCALRHSPKAVVTVTAICHQRGIVAGVCSCQGHQEYDLSYISRWL